MKFSDILIITLYILVLASMFIVHKFSVDLLNNRLDRIEVAICKADVDDVGQIEWKCKKGN